MVTTIVISPSVWVAYLPAAIFLLGLAWAALNPFARWRLRALPGPTPMPLLGSIVDIARRDITHLVAGCSRKYGKVFMLWMGSQPWVVMSDPELIRKYSFRLLSRPFSRKTALHTLTGEAYEQDKQSLLFMRNGPEWRLARRAFEQSLVHPTSLAAHMRAVERGIGRALPRLDRHVGSGEPLEAGRFLAQMVLGILGEAAFGVDFHTMSEDGVEGDPAAVGRQLADAVRESLDCINIHNISLYQPLKWMFPGLTPLWYWLAERLPDKNQLRHMAARKRLADITRQLMAQWQHASRQRDGGPGPAAAGTPPPAASASSSPSFAEVGGGISSSSFLASLLEGRRGAQQHDRLTDVQVAGQCLIFLIAGFETTSATISYTLFLLASNPEAQARLQQEVDQHVATTCKAGGDGSGEAAAAGAAGPGQLPYLEAVLQEAMRLYPSVSMTLRYASEDLDLGYNGIVVPKGTTVLLATHAMMHDPAVWPQPEAFLPQRFLPGQGQGLLPRGQGQGAGGGGGEAGPGSAWAPFGLGPRMCVGNKFATMVAKAVLLQLVRRYTFSVHEKQVLEEGPGGVRRLRTRTDLTHMPRDGVWLSVHAR